MRVSTYLGSFLQRSPTDIEFGVLDADKGITAGLEHTGTLDSREYAYIQAAVLYTTVSGQRRVRVCNLAVPVVELAGNVFRFADMDATIAFMFRQGGALPHRAQSLTNTDIRQAISSMARKRLPTIREDLTEQCSSVLLGYRTKCVSATRSSQVSFVVGDTW